MEAVSDIFVICFIYLPKLSYAAFSCCGIDGKLGGLTPMNSYARLVCIRGITTTVIGLPR